MRDVSTFDNGLDYGYAFGPDGCLPIIMVGCSENQALFIVLFIPPSLPLIFRPRLLQYYEKENEIAFAFAFACVKEGEHRT